ncbi:hypothetical protein DPM19_03085 [Actinomadura craniellae]|uniref:YCII-related domain-containing protein n=1 Tax=Actinomadura craniellae TaxID=2231787 RepID=A0A365HDE9_9ACTN|nr:YciI family protein [Actinomadura craniellae]RAY17154.1 hypothetical protein DPM19_03085 [Actinomadura craniellae]
MRYLALLKAARPATPPPPELFEEISKLGDAAIRAGVLLDGGGLAPSAAGARIEVSGGELGVTDGPSPGSREIVGYALYQVRSKEEVVEWCSRLLRLHRDLWEGWEGHGEILQVLAPGDAAPRA